MSKEDQYARTARRWSDEQYADPRAYLAHRAELVVSLGPRLDPGDVVVDLACGDGGLAAFLPQQRYLGVDATPEMVEAARARGRDVVLGDLNEFEPPQRAAATTCFRALYYVRDRRDFFARVAGYTEKKLVFDLNPRRYETSDVLAELRAAGWQHVALRPFFVSQTHAPHRALAATLRALERSGPLARLLLRFRFTYLVAAWKGTYL